ncbi:alpha/beta fold hydrolase [Gloeothece verrucosa]|uniref:Alpha/beta hydrolase fold protein n=1 Tax=Gloeothece verrucosa (strain PCC 7822) TaxID=497965 RepID=E0UAR7_GLOV7|nr:alpha/beta fold hydrolase [Gloeothece verrucosa]ADN13919.1 alpha/beta hydrolase fold protein [Gloeothece verrucosa PCC 7822]
MMMSSEALLSNTAAKTWMWKGFRISYQSAGDTGPAVVLVHGFGASWGHWRKNLPVLGQTCRCYALDLIGFGGSAKPKPKLEIDYTFETWGQQVADFCREVVGSPAFLVGNSIGCVVIMQAAVDYPELVLGIAAINCSLRLLHERKRSTIPWYRSLGAGIAQKLLTNQKIGHFFFAQIAKPQTVQKILLQAYRRKEAVTEELIEMLMKPALDAGAADVFLAFTGYSGGPLPEDLLPILPCSAIFLWGEEDPWEPIALGREYAKFPTVEQFIPLKELGHCPQDEAPELVNPILIEWISRKQQQATGNGQ